MVRLGCDYYSAFELEPENTESRFPEWERVTAGGFSCVGQTLIMVSRAIHGFISGGFKQRSIQTVPETRQISVRQEYIRPTGLHERPEQ